MVGSLVPLSIDLVRALPDLIASTQYDPRTRRDVASTLVAMLNISIRSMHLEADINTVVYEAVSAIARYQPIRNALRDFAAILEPDHRFLMLFCAQTAASYGPEQSTSRQQVSSVFGQARHALLKANNLSEEPRSEPSDFSTDQFIAMAAPLQTPLALGRMQQVFDSSPDEIGRAATAAAKKRG